MRRRGSADDGSANTGKLGETAVSLVESSLATRRKALGAAAAVTVGALADRALSPDAASAETTKEEIEAIAYLSSPEVKTANYTYVASDLGKTVEGESAETELVFTVPKGVFAVGATLIFRQVGKAKVSLAAASGVKFLIPEGLEAKTKGQWSSGALHQRAENYWVLMGDLQVTPYGTL
jgi:hypothetical protein